MAGVSAWWGLTTKVDNLMLDVAAPLRMASPDDRILIVEIDNDTLAKLGNFPWARRIHAQFLNRAKSAGPRVIAYDILFLEPMDPADDAAMANAVRQGAPTYLPVLYQVPGENGAAETMIMPIEPLPTAAAGLGEVNLLFDSDGLVRRAQLQTNAASRALPHLMELTYREMLGKPSAAYQRKLAESTTATDETLYVPMAHVGTFRRLSFASVLSGEVPPAFLKDKVLLVGATADGMGDRYPVSALAGSSMAGIEIQANLLNALLHDRFVEPVGRGFALAYSMLPVLTLMLLFWWFKPTVNLMLSVAMIGIVLSVTIILIGGWGLWFPPASAMLGIFLVYPLWGWRRLSALSTFIGTQNRTLRDENELLGQAADTAGLDRLGRQAADLEDVISQIRTLKREREEMLEFLSHDMRAPQSAILMLLSEGDEVSGAGKARIAANARKTLRLADDFVQLARFKAVDLVFEDVDVAAVASEAIDGCWPQANAKNMVIEGDGLDQEAFVRGDASALSRALSNLLDNAVKYGPANSEVRCDVAIGDQHVEVSVSDKGPGLPPERTRNIFARFGDRGDTKETGSGLGLAFVSAVVQRHGGTIECASAPGKGTRFTITLPMADLD